MYGAFTRLAHCCINEFISWERRTSRSLEKLGRLRRIKPRRCLAISPHSASPSLTCTRTSILGRLAANARTSPNTVRPPYPIIRCPLSFPAPPTPHRLPSGIVATFESWAVENMPPNIVAVRVLFESLIGILVLVQVRVFRSVPFYILTSR